MRQGPILIDVDGVLADFTTAFTREMHKIDPAVVVCNARYQRTWNFDAPKPVIDAAWDIVKNSDSWWMTLAPMPGAGWNALRKLQNWAAAEERQLIVCTNRSLGKNVALQTFKWLDSRFAWSPDILFAEHGEGKAKIAEALGAYAAIDDSPRVLRHYVKVIPTYAPRYPYNVALEGVSYVEDFHEFVKQITGQEVNA